MNRWQGVLKNIEDLDRLKRTLDPLLGYRTRSHPKPNQLIHSSDQESACPSSSATAAPISVTSPTDCYSTLPHTSQILRKSQTMSSLNDLPPQQFHELMKTVCRSPDFRQSIESVKRHKPQHVNRS
ncbi:hypothetical protein PGTUg99_001442 [Puccinia graminis f. sp. tritici]|uniref:Uncharacterized protein n=1 Tax=Puccinia graminis f. sp. tritici TaxID=56615 RepID=A0A5B0LJJ8_PUCGR|nr:hypothetical protein PGTUg99_001442 [Puccinia graminis f. sp. tritici]